MSDLSSLKENVNEIMVDMNGLGLSGSGGSDNVSNGRVVSFAGRLLKLDSELDAKPIIEAMDEAMDGLVELCLEGNTLGISAAKELAKSLESKSSLQLVLFNNLFTGRLKTEIPEVLLFLTSGIMLSNAKLKTLDLSDNAIGPVGMPSLLPFLQSASCRTLETLRLNNCGLGVAGGQILAKGLPNLKALKTLICGRNRLEIIGSEAIGNALAELTTLETLEMPQNGIHSKGIEAICRAIEANNGLKNLNLNDNNLKTESKTIAESLKSLDSIETINFGDCLLRRSGCEAICEALIESNTSNVREINLSGNEIGGKQVIDAIIKCVQNIVESSSQQNMKLKLELNNNNFGESGVEKLNQILGEKIDLNICDDEGSDEETEVADTGLALRDKSEKNVEELTKLIENDCTDLNDLCSQFVKISINGFDSKTSTMKEEALTESELCLKSVVGVGVGVGAKEDRNEYIAINTLLVNLGLLKDETGLYRTVDDLRGPLSALTHSIQHLSPHQKQVLRAFMNRPNRAVEQCGKIKHSLMHRLFI